MPHAEANSGVCVVGSGKMTSTFQATRRARPPFWGQDMRVTRARKRAHLSPMMMASGKPSDRHDIDEIRSGRRGGAVELMYVDPRRGSRLEDPYRESWGIFCQSCLMIGGRPLEL